jgi:hypothetical protein
MDEEIETWLEALAGRAVADEHGSAACEARALREALQRRLPDGTDSAPAGDSIREASLLARARRQGLIPSPVARRPRSWRLGPWPALAALAVIACAAVGITVMLRPTQQAGTVRGGGPGIVRLTAADPAALKADLLRELRAAGIEASGYRRLGREGIDADLPAPVPARVRAILARHRIPVPADGVLEVEIAPVQPP